MRREHAEGFPPVYDATSRLLILGSFPSVKSRQISFFGEDVPADVAGKREFLLRRHIALWDVAESCTVQGSSDASIGDVVPADIPRVLSAAPIEKIVLNGGKAYALFRRFFPAYIERAERLPSTSPADLHFSAEAWERALGEVFGT